MQFIEVTEFPGVRAARWIFKSSASRLQFVLFPMIHLAEARFYAEVTEQLRACDLIIAERAPRKPRGARALIRSYALADGSSRLGLVRQRINYKDLGVPLIVPDISADDFEQSWQRLPRTYALAVRVVYPAYGLWTRYFATRRHVAHDLTTEQMPTVRRPELDDRAEALSDLIIDERDQRLVEAIRDVHNDHHDEEISVGIVWGAEHMLAVARGLHALGYSPRSGEWITVFALDP